MIIDAETQRNTDPRYLRGLMERAGLSTRAAARRIGVDSGHLRAYLREPDPKVPCPYPVQVALEALAAAADSNTSPNLENLAGSDHDD